MRMSQSDLADYLGVAQSTLSKATSNLHKCAGYPVHAWAKFDGSGRVTGYDVPERVMRRPSPASVQDEPEETLPAMASKDPSGSGGIFGLEKFVRESSEWSCIPGFPDMSPPGPGLGFDDMEPGPLFDASQRTSLLPENEDYFRPTASGGAAYVMHAAIESDNGTARSAVMVSGAAIGGLTGSYVTDGDPIGAALGAGIGLFAAWTGIRSANVE